MTENESDATPEDVMARMMEAMTGGGIAALDAFRAALIFTLGNVSMMPPEVRAVTSLEDLVKTLITTLDGAKVKWREGEPARHAVMLEEYLKLSTANDT